MNSVHKKKILVTDGGNVNTLGIIRHLGILKQFEIHVIGSNKAAICRFSKYCTKFYILPSAKTAAFFDEVLALIAREKFDFVMPVGFYAYKVFVANQEILEQQTKVCLPGRESFEIASSKTHTREVAMSVGVKAPLTYSFRQLSEVEATTISSFPVVIKSQKEIGGRMVDYAHDRGELISKYSDMVSRYKLEPDSYPIVQEYISGPGVGFFAYYNNGRLVHYFMHERVREFPVSGGRSVCAKSIYDVELFKAGKALLDALKWNGCAMVEFKRTVSGEFYLLEINPKLWGSLELALCCGVNFPLYLINAPEQANTALRVDSYPKGVFFQWMLNGECYYFINRPWKLFSIIATAFKSHKDIWFRDLKPNVIQFFLAFLDLYKFIRAK